MAPRPTPALSPQHLPGATANGRRGTGSSASTCQSQSVNGSGGTAKLGVEATFKPGQLGCSKVPGTES